VETLNSGLFAAMFVCSLFAGIAKAEMPPLPTAEETVTTEQGALVVKVVTETERYALPPIDFPAKDIPKVLAIVRQGEGVYEMEKVDERGSWVFGLPMARETQITKTAINLKNGRWSEEKLTEPKPLKETMWLMTAVLAAIVAGVAVSSLCSQRSGKSDKKLFWFYGQLLLCVMSGFAIALIAIGAGNHPIPSLSGVLSSVFIVVIVIIGALILSYGKYTTTEGATLLLAFPGALGMVLTGSVQYIELATFLAATIAVSYLLAKIAKRLYPPAPTRMHEVKCSRFYCE